jgi:hypothetical protein
VRQGSSAYEHETSRLQAFKAATPSVAPSEAGEHLLATVAATPEIESGLAALSELGDKPAATIGHRG